MRRAEAAVVVGLEQGVPARAPHHLDHPPAGAAEDRLELLDDLGVAAHRAVEPLEVAVDHEDQVVEALAHREADRADRLDLVHLAVAEEGPDLARGGVGEAAAVQVFEEAGLVDRHQGAQAHRHGGELPEVGHQPGMRVGGEAAGEGLLAEALQLLLGEPAFDEGAGVDPGRGVALEEDQVAAVLLGGRVPEMVEAGLEELGRALVGGDVAADAFELLVGVDHQGHGVPAHQRHQPRLRPPGRRGRAAGRSSRRC